MMSLPGFSNVDPVNQILPSIAVEERGLRHILHTEGEKMQYNPGMLPGLSGPAGDLRRSGGVPVQFCGSEE